MTFRSVLVNGADDLADVHVLEGALGDFVADRLVARLDAQREPADAGAPEQVQIVRLHGVDPGVGPHAELEAALDEEIEQRLEEPLVEEEHLVRDAQGLHTEPGELLEFADDETRGPEPHVGEWEATTPSALSTRLTMLIMQKSHLNLQPERGVDGGEGGAEVVD